LSHTIPLTFVLKSRRRVRVMMLRQSELSAT
jgi:hypothetical protein